LRDASHDLAREEATLMSQYNERDKVREAKVVSEARETRETRGTREAKDVRETRCPKEAMETGKAKQDQ
jgi:hypothetical protein